MTILFAKDHEEEDLLAEPPLPRIISIKDVIKRGIHQPPTGFEVKLIEVQTYIQEHYYDSITIRDLAQYVGTNEHKLKVRFKERFGITLFGYLRQVRMNNAIYMLKVEARPIKEVAHMVGYSNISNFTNAFKRLYGYPPSRVLREGR